MKFELTKSEAKKIWEIINYNQNLGMANLCNQIRLLNDLDKRDNSKRLEEWLDESAKEFDEFQTIKVKMSAVIDEVKNDL